MLLLFPASLYFCSSIVVVSLSRTLAILYKNVALLEHNNETNCIILTLTDVPSLSSPHSPPSSHHALLLTLARVYVCIHLHKFFFLYSYYFIVQL